MNINKSIRMKLMGGFSVVLVLLAFICFAGVSSMMRMSSGDVTVEYMKKAEIAVIILTVIGIMIGLFVEIQVIRDIRRPIQVLTTAAEKLTYGDIEIDLHKYADNELGELTDDFRKLVDNVNYQAEVAGKIAEGNLDFEVNVKSDRDVLGNAFAKIVREQDRKSVV